MNIDQPPPYRRAAFGQALRLHPGAAAGERPGHRLMENPIKLDITGDPSR